MHSELLLVVRTPYAEVFRGPVDALRMSTETGQVGARARAEASVVAIEPGLLLLRRQGETLMVGTAGGVLCLQGMAATVLSPLAVVGHDAEDVKNKLDALAVETSSAMELRRRIESLERGLAAESQRGSARNAQRGAP